MRVRSTEGGHRADDERIVRLPCGHEIGLPHGAPVIGVSGPILDHQAGCPLASPANELEWPESGSPGSTGAAFSPRWRLGA